MQLDPFFQTGSKPKFYKFGIVEPMLVMRVRVIEFWVVALGETTDTQIYCCH